MNKVEYDKIYNYIKKSEIPGELETSHARFGFKRKCRSYVLDEGEDAVYYIQKNKDGSIRRRSKVIVGTNDDAKAVFLEVHRENSFTHPGFNRTLQSISRKYFWPRMTYDITEWIRSCPICQKDDKTKLVQLKVTEPWEILTMSIIGPVNETAEGYKFIFTATDYYSKWVEAFPICNKYPAEVAACLKLIFYRHGACKSVLSDECIEFITEVNNELVKQLGIQHRIKAVYHPNIKTFDEKCAQQLNSTFLNLVVEHAFDWPHYIDGLLFTLRTKKHHITKFTPFYLIHRREARMPPVSSTDPVASIDSEFDLNTILEPNYETAANKDHLGEIRSHEKVMENVKSANLDQIIENAREWTESKEHRFTIGEKVLLVNSKKRPAETMGSDAPHSGPFVITDIKTNKVRLMCLKDSTQFKVMPSVERIIPYRESYKITMFE